MPSPTLDSVATALKAVLAPAGVPVGTLKSVLIRSPEVPIAEPTPALLFPPLSASVQWAAISVGRAHWRGYLTLTYLDRLPAQQGAPGSTTLATVEDAMIANLEVIVATIIANPKLGGAVNYIGAIPGANGQGGEQITVTPNLGGPIRDDFNQDWVTFSIKVPFLGLPQTV